MPSTQAFLDELPIEEVTVGFGDLGLHGELGYEGQHVVVRGRQYARSLSLHPPGRAIVRLGGKFHRFTCQVALNDDVSTGVSHADFRVLADGQLVAAGGRVLAGGLPCVLEADVQGADVLELVVETSRATYCHAVWLDPRVEGGGVGTVLDCLERIEIEPPATAQPAHQCIATIVTHGYAQMLDTFLNSVRANAACEDAVLVVLTVGSDPECKSVARTHGAIVIPGHLQRPLNPSVKSALYSMARIVPADQFICLDVDTIVLGSLRPLFAALEACPPGSILACADQNQETYPTLGRALAELYGGSDSDLESFLGAPQGEDHYEIVFNDGAFAAGRLGLLALDSALRAMPGAAQWLNASWLRNQFLFNLALARMRCGIRMDDVYNLQLHAQGVRRGWRGGRIEAYWRGRSVRVLHFNARGREKYEEWHRLFTRGCPD